MALQGTSATVRSTSLPALRAAWAPYVLITLLPVLFSVPFLTEAMEQDEAVYFSVAGSGALPYVAVFDHKPPLIYAWYALAMLLGGGASLEMVRVFAMLHLAATALAVAWTGTMLAGRRAGILAGLMMGFAVADQYLQFNANTEAFTVLPLTLGLGAFVRALQGGGNRWWLLAGGAAGIAAMTKTPALLHVVALLGVLAWAACMGEIQWRSARAGAAAFAAGAASVIAGVMAPFALSGHLGDFWYANVTYNIAYSDGTSFLSKIFALTEMDNAALTGGLPLWGLAFAGLALVAMMPASAGRAALVASALAALAGASSTGREYAHYWVTLTPFAALLAGIGLARLSSNWGSVRSRLHAEALLLLLVLPAVAALSYLYAQTGDGKHLKKFGGEVNAQRAIASDELAARVAALTRSGDEIFVFGHDAQVYTLSGRSPATYFTRPVAAYEVDPASFDRTMRELEASPPALVVDSALIDLPAGVNGAFAFGPREIDASPAVRERFDAFVAANYEPLGRVQYAWLWLRKDRAGQ